ncbi:MAG: glycosyltransferase [Patescibacteria group bacterium]
MRLLLLSTDKKILEENSAVRQRMLDYAGLVDHLDITVFNLADKDKEIKDKIKIAQNAFVYPTNSKFKLNYYKDAINIAIEELDEIDLVSAQDPYETGFIAYKISEKINTKLELQIHTDIFNPNFIRFSWGNRFRYFVAKFLLDKADSIRVVSKRIKLSLPEKYQSRITVLPIFIDPFFISNQKVGFDLHKKYPRFKFIIVMISRLSREKNIGLALYALKDVLKILPKTGLVIVGDGPERKNLKRIARKTGVEENVIFKSWVENPVPYYKSANLFLNTSFYEGYGMSLVEATLSGCPVMTTKVGIVGEILSSNNAFLVEMNNRKNLAKNIINAQQHPELLEACAKKAQQDYMNKSFHSRNEYLRGFKEMWEKTSL